MKYKVWFWICLGVSITLILMTIVIHIANERAFAKQYEFAKLTDSISSCLGSYNDSIRNQLQSDYEERIRIEVERYKKEILSQRPHSGYGTEPHSLYEDSIRIRKELEMEYNARIEKYEQEEAERLTQVSAMINAQEQSETNNGFEKVSGAASILGLFFTFFFRYRDSKEKQKENEEDKGKNKHEGLNLTNIPFSVPTQAETKKAAAFTFRIEYRNYMNFITYTNNGNCEARNVMVSVEQSKTETESETTIENATILPIDWVGVGDTVDLEVSCYYKKTYRLFTIEWEDEAGKHSQRSNLLLSKYLYEQP